MGREGKNMKAGTEQTMVLADVSTAMIFGTNENSQQSKSEENDTIGHQVTRVDLT